MYISVLPFSLPSRCCSDFPINCKIIQKSSAMAASSTPYQKLLSVGTKIIGVGRNYASHAKELGNPLPKVTTFVCNFYLIAALECLLDLVLCLPFLKEPLLFMKPTSSYLEDGGTVEVPEGQEVLDPEVELAVVIGQRARDVPEAKAMDYVGGWNSLTYNYTVCHNLCFGIDCWFGMPIYSIRLVLMVLAAIGPMEIVFFVLEVKTGFQFVFVTSKICWWSRFHLFNGRCTVSQLVTLQRG